MVAAVVGGDYVVGGSRKKTIQQLGRIADPTSDSLPGGDDATIQMKTESELRKAHRINVERRQLLPRRWS